MGRFWREIIRAKYGVKEGGSCSIGRESLLYGTRVWRWIDKDWRPIMDLLVFSLQMRGFGGTKGAI